MEKIRQFFRDLSEKKSYQVIYFVISMCIVMGGYFCISAKVDKMIVPCKDDLHWEKVVFF